MNKKIEKIILVCLESFKTSDIIEMLSEEGWSAGAKRIFSEEIARREVA